MAFNAKAWADRVVEFPGRRRLKDAATGAEMVMDVTRAEGTVLKEGDAFSAENMNDLESRIGDAFNELGESVADGKALVASAITAKGVATAASASFATMANNIRAISTSPDIVQISGSGSNYANYNDNADRSFTKYFTVSIPGRPGKNVVNVFLSSVETKTVSDGGAIVVYFTKTYISSWTQGTATVRLDYKLNCKWRNTTTCVFTVAAVYA